ncbi:hypothetical protein N7540_005427 [Penicillium herquei]|nr:hypothetical protein N7540_005427 [Penicillium herquei]
MEEEALEASLISHQPRRLRLLYEPLCLLHSLGEVRGDRIKPGELSHEGSGLTGPRCYRSFVDAIAYICAYRKEPDYVTAAALEDTPDAIVVVLAANGGIDRDVVIFLETVVLVILSWVVKNYRISLVKKEGQKVMKVLADYVLSLNAPKIFQYYQQVNKAVSSLVQRLSNEPGLKDDKSIIRLRNWFAANLSKDGIPLQECDMPDLAFNSYKDRETFKALHIHPGNLDQSRKHERLFKLLFKLGKHVAQCKRLIEATIGLHSELSRGFLIKTISGSPEKPITLVARTCKIQEISNRMFSESGKREIFLQQLQKIYSGPELDRVLSKDHCKRRTRVHAELLVLDYFEQMGGRFPFEQDRYIGCSKPACYLCYLFISFHPGGYTGPPSHQKLYLNWRIPDIRANSLNAAIRFQHQIDILPRMIDTVRLDLKNDIALKVGRRNGYADSTAGGFSTIIDIPSDPSSSANDISLSELLRILQIQHQDEPSKGTHQVDPAFHPGNFVSFDSEGTRDVESDDDSVTGGVII